MNEDQEKFRTLLRKIASGENTSQSLNRKESYDALNLILNLKATPAQIGAFLVAHRIKRPEPLELAGMVDLYRELGPSIISAKNQRRPICMGMPFDGRKRTSPIYPLTALCLLSIGQPIVMQGGERMPVKYGITTKELFHSLGLDLSGLKLESIQKLYKEKSFALIYQPDHFPLAQRLISFREEIGKRPPIASLELIWTAHKGEHLFISGFVHPPTEKRTWETFKLLGESDFITIKGLEGGVDLPTSRACITARFKNNNIERNILNPKKYNLYNDDLEFESIEIWKDQAIDALSNKGPLRDSLIWNSSVYIWFSGHAENISDGIDIASEVICSGKAIDVLNDLIKNRDSF